MRQGKVQVGGSSSSSSKQAVTTVSRWHRRQDSSCVNLPLYRGVGGTLTPAFTETGHYPSLRLPRMQSHAKFLEKTDE